MEPASPWKMLAVAVIARAVYDLKGKHICNVNGVNEAKNRNRIRREAEDFINSESLDFWINFGDLELCPSWLRSELSKIKRRLNRIRKSDLENMERLQEDAPQEESESEEGAGTSFGYPPKRPQYGRAYKI